MSYLLRQCVLNCMLCMLCIITTTPSAPPPRSEESTAIPGVGVDKLLETGRLDHIKNGPIFWVDSADSQPCMGRSETCKIELCLRILFLHVHYKLYVVLNLCRGALIEYQQ